MLVAATTCTQLVEECNRVTKLRVLESLENCRCFKAVRVPRSLDKYHSAISNFDHVA